jgi:predicted enzyme related to lactoylglutathione lyase
LAEIEGLDFVGVPSTDWKRTRAFYVETLGLRPDEHSEAEFWVGETCFAIWQPTDFGLTFAPQKGAALALRVDDIDAVRGALEAEGVRFVAETFDTGVCKMAPFVDPDGNDVMLHSRHAPYADEKTA